MSAFVYANGQYHLLAGNKIVKDAALLDMKSTDKIIVNGQAYNLGAGSSVTPEIPEVPDAPTLSDMVHDNGTEPATGNKWYITPDGAGSMDGSSWENAASASMIHVILLSAASGDSIYFAEGDYTADRTLTLPSGVSLFGGFPSENPSWETRNAFTHQTVWTASHSGAWLASTSNVSGQLVDGFTLMNYAGTTADGNNLTFKNMTLSSGNFTTAGKLENCYVTGVTLNAGSVSSCKAVNSPATITNAEDTDFYYASVEVSGNAEDCNIYGKNASKVDCIISGTATNCTAVNCTSTCSASGSYSYIFYGTATNCTAVNCTSTGSDKGSCIFRGTGEITNCTAVNCTSTGSGAGCIFRGTGEITNCTAVNCTSTCSASGSSSYIFYGTATNCTAVNCTSTGSGAGSICCIFRNSNVIKNCTAVNCISTCLNGSSYSYIFDGAAMNCTAVNCTSSCPGIGSYSSIYYFFGTDEIKITNCTAVNCTSTGSDKGSCIFYSGNGEITNCTAVNCISTGKGAGYIFSNGKNCLSWNNSGTEFTGTKITCAGSVYDATLALTLGTDNSIARFTNTGFAPAKGVQDVGDCPSPLDDPDGYAEWLSAFGDWHPAADSFLLGAGTADSSVTTDADGVTRPDPPSIGAFEAKPA